MSCGKDSCCGEDSCHEGTCHDECKHHHHHENHEEECNFGKELLNLADKAWMKVLEEKIKEKIIATNGARMDKLAEFIAQSNNARWKGKMAAKKACADFKEKLEKILCSE